MFLLYFKFYLNDIICSDVFHYPRDFCEVKFPLRSSFENPLEKKRFELFVHMKKLIDC